MLGLPFDKGGKLENEDSKRTMKIIPSIRPRRLSLSAPLWRLPLDKAITEIGVSQFIKTHYPKAKFIGFVMVSAEVCPDYMRMVAAYEDVSPSTKKNFPVLWAEDQDSGYRSDLQGTLTCFDGTRQSVDNADPFS